MRTERSAFLLAATVTGVFFVNGCAVVFQCGCRSLWDGVAAFCNIHNAVGPHCPWCEHPLAGGGIAFGAALAAQWMCCNFPKRAGFVTRFLLALAAFPLVSGLVALVQGLIWGYGSR